MIQVNNLSLVPPIPFLISEGKQTTQNLCLMIGNNEFWVDAAISRILDSILMFHHLVEQLFSRNDVEYHEYLVLCYDM